MAKEQMREAKKAIFIMHVHSRASRLIFFSNFIDDNQQNIVITLLKICLAEFRGISMSKKICK